jgi:protein-S-isoprenylcysteine O-methyltransferase Ste14
MGMKEILGMRPPRIAMGLLALTVGLWHLSPQNTVLHVHYKLIGSMCIMGGFIVMICGWLPFRKAKTAICPTVRPTALVTAGAFKISRNPIYLGMLMMLMGSSFLMGTIPSLFAPIAFFLIIDKVFIPYEEEKMIEAFGAEYSDYVQKTRRWI